MEVLRPGCLPGFPLFLHAALGVMLLGDALCSPSPPGPVGAGLGRAASRSVFLSSSEVDGLGRVGAASVCW